jgi:flagellar basal-body rod protein FlgC
MPTSLNSSLNALHSLFTKFSAGADNIANLNTDGYKRTRVDIREDSLGNPAAVVSIDNRPGPTRLEPGQDGELEEVEMSNVDLASELVANMVTENTIRANLKSAATQDEILGETIDILG